MPRSGHHFTQQPRWQNMGFSRSCKALGEQRRAWEIGAFPAATNKLCVVSFRRVTLIRGIAQAVESGLPRLLQGGVTDLAVDINLNT